MRSVVESAFTDPGSNAVDLIVRQGLAVVRHPGLECPFNHLYEDAVVGLSDDDKRGYVVPELVVGRSKEVEPGLRTGPRVAPTKCTALLKQRIDVLRIADIRIGKHDVGDIRICGPLVLT